MSQTTKIKKAIFPVGGFGIRFLPVTKSMPKEMLPIANKPLIQHAFEEAKEAGIEQFIFVIGRNKSSIMDHFDQAFELEHALEERDKLDILDLTKKFVSTPGNVIFIRQQQPLGLGHAIWCARHVIGNEPFSILLADEFFISKNKKSVMSDMISGFKGDNLIAVSEIDIKDSDRYGIVKIQNNTIDQIVDMVEKPESQNAPSNLAIVGRYILQPIIFDYLEKLVCNTQIESGKEIQLTDAMSLMLKNNNSYKAFKVNAERIDCGNYLGFLEANIRVSMQNPNFKFKVQNMLKKIVDEL